MRIEWIIGFLGIFGVTSVIGNLITPILIKRFEKRTCIIFMRSIWAAVTACYLIALKLPVHLFDDLIHMLLDDCLITTY